MHVFGLFQERLGVGEEFSEIYRCKQFGMPFNKNSTSEYAVMIAKECKHIFFSFILSIAVEMRFLDDYGVLEAYAYEETIGCVCKNEVKIAVLYTPTLIFQYLAF